MNRPEKPAGKSLEPGAQSQSREAPNARRSEQSSGEALPDSTRTHQGQMGTDQTPELKRKGEVTQNKGEPKLRKQNAQEPDQRSVQTDRNDLQQPRQTQRKNPPRGQSEEDRTSSTQRTMQSDQQRAGNFEFNKNVEQDNGQPMIRRGDNRRNTLQGNISRQSDRGAVQGNRAEGGRIDIQKGTRLRETFRHDKVEPEHDGNFSVSIGESVPQRVHFHPLPPDIVAIVPEYRGYEYVQLPDRIVIVDPPTRRIVYVIDKGRDRREGRANSDSRARFALSPEQKRAVRSEIVRQYQGDRNPNFAIRLGEHVPEAIDLEPVPQDVYVDVPDMEPYRYFVAGDEVVIVDPRTREIVDVID